MKMIIFLQRVTLAVSSYVGFYIQTGSFFLVELLKPQYQFPPLDHLQILEKLCVVCICSESPGKSCCTFPVG